MATPIAIMLTVVAVQAAPEVTDAASKATPATRKAAPDRAVDRALSRWEALWHNADFDQVRQWSDVVRREGVRGDDAVLERLLAISRSTDQTEFSRSQALWIASELADAEGAKRIIAVVRGFLDKIEEAWKDRQNPSREYIIRSTGNLVNSFVRFAASNVDAAIDDHGELLELLRDIYLSKHRMAPEVRDECAKLIAECSAPLSAKQAVVLEFIRDESNRRGSPPDVLLDLLDGSALPELRWLMRAETDRSKFNYAAAHALAYLGDADSLADFEDLRPLFESWGNPARDAHRRMVWQIKVQNPPAKLLDHIATPSTDFSTIGLRTWAVQRALKLGIDPTDIRAAILRLNEQGQTRLGRGELPLLKRQGLQLGILKPDDLPEVEVSRPGRKP